MGSLKNPRTWVPYINTKDCSKRICNIHCTQWCKYIVLPSPPPPPTVNHSGDATLSPTVITIITIIIIFFLLIVNYVIISRYCFRNNVLSATRGVESQEILDLEIEDDGYNEEVDLSSYVPWLVLGKGLDEGFIKSITICKYKKEDGLVSCTDCSVCLGEFEEDESVRVLPKCSHVFHVYCIDTWLKTHSNCPLCRANVCCVNALPVIPPPPPMINSDLSGREAITEIREERCRREIRRSFSTGYLCETRASMANVLFHDNQDEEMAR